MRKNLLLIFGVLMLNSVFLYAQNQKIDFKYVEHKEGKKEVVFTVLGLDTPEKVQNLKQSMTTKSGVEDFQIFYGRRCRALINESVTADELRSLILLQDAEIHRDYVHIYDKKTEYEISGYTLHNPIKNYTRTAGTRVFPADFPTMRSTGDAEKDAAEMKAAKTRWAEENSDKYLEVMGHEYLDFDKQPATNPRTK